MESNSYQDFLALAVKAARLAGEALRKGQKELCEISAQPARDVKLKADSESEKIILEILRSQTPFAILSEEVGVIPATQASSLRWIVDPLDGTVNYLEGLPFCCVSISLWKNEEPRLGVVYDFLRDELYSGIVGVGAWLNGNGLSVKKTRPVNQAILCTGFPVAIDFSQSTLEGFVKNIVSFKKVRLFGSAALSLAFVAAGHTDAYYEKSIKLWDVAAGLALVKAAGGVIAANKQALADVVDAYAGSSWLVEMQNDDAF
jgi:myo-inositol-1(or 4)-monophosphatase